tara:strand:+ start:1152 stop:2027 length:876 start_codon:yes stop_codon:yes gene_type:complete
MTAYIYPGQGSQYCGMGKDLFDSSNDAKRMFEAANKILDFEITNIMFGQDIDELKKTKVTQPAIFIHSVILSKILNFKPQIVAGHSLGEFSALVASKALNYEDALFLVSKRANAMEEACIKYPGTMAAVIGLNVDLIESVCEKVGGIIKTANYNCPGQIVISGEKNSIENACEILKKKGAKRAIILPVGGAFHSPLMTSAKNKLAMEIEKIKFNTPSCPIYQNFSNNPETDPEKIKFNLIEQMTSPVKWTQCVEKMIKNGANKFVEVGPGKVLQGLVKKINSSVEISSAVI